MIRPQRRQSSVRAGLEAGLLPWGHGFDSRAVRVAFVVNRAAVDTDFSLCVSVFHGHRHSVSAAYSHFIHTSRTLWQRRDAATASVMYE